MALTYSIHAEVQIAKRRVPREVLSEVIHEPQQRTRGRRGRQIHQSRYYDPVEGKEMVLRVVLEVRGEDAHVVTLYKSSRIDKYWGREASR